MSEINKKQVNPRSSFLNPDLSDNRYNYDTYEKDYFCGSAVKVYFGDIYVDDIITIQYSVNQNKTPIYGYASTNFDAVAGGQIIVEGNITVAFKETGYLNVIMNTLKEQKLSQNNISSVENKVKSRVENAGPVQSTSDIVSSLSSNLSPTLVRQAQTIEQVLDNLKDGDTSNIVTNNDLLYNSSTKSTRDFEDMAEILEDSIWGDAGGKYFDGTNFNKQLLRVDEFDYKYNSSLKPIGIKSWNRLSEYNDCLNILVAFGDLNSNRAEHTLIMINDVHFKSQGMVCAPNGDPIAEVYSFFARDINKSLRQFNINPEKFNKDIQYTSKVQDIEKLRASLNDYGPVHVQMKIVSEFINKWTPTSDVVTLDTSTFPSKMDPLFRSKFNVYIEDQVQKYYIYDTTTRPDKIAVEVTVQDLSDNKLYYLLDRTLTGVNYKITSPTNTEYIASDVILREDFFFNGIATSPVQTPVPEVSNTTNPNPGNPIKEVTKSDENANKAVDLLNNIPINYTPADKPISLETSNKTTNFTIPTDGKPLYRVDSSGKVTAIKPKDNVLNIPYLSSFQDSATSNNVSPSLLIGIGAQESQFNPKAVSSADARGIMQLKEGAAEDVGVVDRFNPSDNIEGGAKYIKTQLKTFNQSEPIALAAYNYGGGNVQKALFAEYDNYNQFTTANPTPDAQYNWIQNNSNIPLETKDYVTKVLSYKNYVEQYELNNLVVSNKSYNKNQVKITE